MLNPLKRVARVILEEASAHHPDHREARGILRLEQGGPGFVTPQDAHLDAAIRWILEAQRASGPDGGVAWGYRARVPVRSAERVGWVAPYPETTGYIIPTMLRYAKLRGDQTAAAAARRMADWEVRIQLSNGGIQGGTYGATPVSASTFVTGQVIFGLVAAYQEWGDSQFRESGARAGDFLLDCLDDTGRFVKGYSLFCAAGSKAYEVRTGLALAELGLALKQDSYQQAASRMADYALSCQQDNGWFRENDLDLHDQPLTHTIGYTLEGLHGIGLLLNRPDCIHAVRLTLDRIAPLIRENGFLAGRWRSDWSPAVEWSCLTGCAQIAGVFLRVHQQLGVPAYLEAARKLLGFVCWTQEIPTSEPGLKGGIRGSYPFSGLYGQWCVLNWATKFFSDSLMDFFAPHPPRRSA